MNRNDVCLIAAILIVAGTFWLIWGKPRLPGQVVITLDGKEYGRYAADSSQVIPVKSPLGENEVVIEHGEVYIKSADCPDKYCVRQGRISAGNESIICLPHKLVVEIRPAGGGRNPADVDAAVY